MRSRIAITFMLVFGFAFSGAGVGLAVTGLGSQDDSAATNQYAVPVPPATAPETGGGTTLAPAPEAPVPAADEGTAPEVKGESQDSPRPEVAGETDDNNVDKVADVQQNRQLGAEQGGEQLPFTGFAAIPVLLLGMALLTAGFVLRRRGSAGV